MYLIYIILNTSILTLFIDKLILILIEMFLDALKLYEFIHYVFRRNNIST